MALPYVFDLVGTHIPRRAGEESYQSLFCTRILLRAAGAVSCFWPSLADIMDALLGLLSHKTKEGFVRTSLSTVGARGQNDFAVISDSFLHDPGLPFASVLDGDAIARVFREEEALFGQEDIFSTQIVLWAFLAQTLRDGKGVACAAAVADIAAYLLQTGQQPPSGNTGDYCRARAKLKLTALQRLVRESAGQLEGQVDQSWLWKGRHAKLVDGFTFTLPDTPENQKVFPQIGAQRPGVGLPIARVCAVLSLATACVCALALGPYEGKETGETALLRGLLETFHENEVVVFDRY
jgi:putative transposase